MNGVPERRTAWFLMREMLDESDCWMYWRHGPEEYYVPYQTGRPGGGSHRSWADVKRKTKHNPGSHLFLQNEKRYG